MANRSGNNGNGDKLYVFGPQNHCIIPVFPSHGALKASTFQMAILLQYNTEDAYAVQQLTDSTQIKMVFQPLCSREGKDPE